MEQRRGGRVWPFRSFVALDRLEIYPSTRSRDGGPGWVREGDIATGDLSVKPGESASVGQFTVTELKRIASDMCSSPDRSWQMTTYSATLRAAFVDIVIRRLRAARGRVIPACRLAWVPAHGTCADVRSSWLCR